MPRQASTDIIEALRQTDSAQKRKEAIPAFIKALRRGDRFQPTWDAVGGAAGLASLMAEFSVKDVISLCKRLGATASAVNAREERRTAMGELVQLLYGEHQDKRPLRAWYQNIIPACHLEEVRKWEHELEIEWAPAQTKRLFLGHREQHEQKFLDRIFSPGNELNFTSQKKLFRGNIPFCEQIIKTLLAKDHNVRVPSDFIDAMAMPLLKRLLKKRFDDETRNKYLGLVVQCIQKHEAAIADQIYLYQGGLVQYTVQRWFDTPADSHTKDETKTYLVQLLELYRVKNRLQLDWIRQAVVNSRKLTPAARDEFLRLILLHVKGYKVDIEDESQSTLARLKELVVENDRWPVMLFFSIDLKKGMQLFEKLYRIHPNSDFLAPVGTWSILNQPQSLGSNAPADVEVARALLIRKSKTEAEHEDWLERVRVLIQERKQNAQVSRDPRTRAFWAKSALSLCAAAGNLETLRDTVIWARRFNKDSLTAKDLYSSRIIATSEFQDLLGAVPEGDTDSPEAAMAFAAALVKKDVDLADQIILDLLETATMAVGEPGFQRSNWTSVLGLPKSAIQRRRRNIKTFFRNIQKCSPSDREKYEADMVETVLKPTISTLIEAEAIIRNPASKALLASSHDVETRGIHIFRDASSSVIPATRLAELARFTLDQMRARLGSEVMGAQMRDIVGVVERLASSDQPALASPFIRDLVLHSEGANDSSAWHRQLLSIKFLSSLPAKAAKEMLENMAGAMRDKLREQNQNWKPINAPKNEPAPEPEKPQSPAIKVTTVKMIAQLLQNNRFIDASSSCDILIGLLAEARHIDILTNITHGLISAMGEPTCPPDIRKRILDALETHIIPVAARLNERRPLTEADWETAAEEGAELPSVSNDASLLDMLVEQARNAKLKPEDKARLAQLIMSVPEQSAVNNGRWMKLFLAKNDFNLDAGEELPPNPVNLQTLASLFRNLMAYMPFSVFNMLHSIVLTNLQPTPGIVRINQAVRGDRNLINSAAGKHWLSQFGNSDLDTRKLGVDHATNALQAPTDEIKSQLPEREGITVDMLQSFVLQFAERLIDKGSTSQLTYLVQEALPARRFWGQREWDSWYLNCRPIVKDIILRAETVRVRQRDGVAQAGAPRSFINTNHIRMWNLPVPYSSESTQQEDAFLSELAELINELGNGRLPYHDDFESLKQIFSARIPRKPDFARFALKLTHLQGIDALETAEPRLADYLRFEFVGHLLSKSENPNDEQVFSQVRDLLRRWEQCEAEGLRRTGIYYADNMRAPKKGNWFSDLDYA
ncbi:hypothetical protein FDECE_9778 [Fusarium decemcellulare]|nr:hypothetical protein FDECE_9778 [Fusarium decemcellulare]